MSDLYVIRKGGYFYRPGAKGYTSSPAEAWLVTKEVAEKHECPDCGPPVTIHPASEFPLTYTAEQVKPLVEALRVLMKAYAVECEAFREGATLRDGTWPDPSDEAEYRTMATWLEEAEEALKQFGEG